MNIYDFWKVTLDQDAVKMRTYFHEDAYINWHDTNEHLTLDEFIRANCEYPGKWSGEIERIEEIRNLIITVTHVYEIYSPLSFHVVSFINLRDDKITSIDEYWGECGPIPQWRLDKNIGSPIK